MIDYSKIKTYPISERQNKFSIKDLIPLDHSVTINNQALEPVASAINRTKQSGGKVILMMGGAVIKVGCSRLIIDLMEKGFIHHIAGNGAVSIHDFEIAMIGETSEDVERGLEDGAFGMVEETGKHLNQAINDGHCHKIGYGEAVGKAIEMLDLPHKEHSIFYQAYRLGIPITVHVSIGQDIIHQHPTCNGEALGATSFLDFQKITESVSGLANGVLLNFGSAVSMPEVFLKALTIVRNLKIDVREFTTANFDFLDMYRPRTRLLEWPKSLGCQAFDIRANHNESFPALHRLLTREG